MRIDQQRVPERTDATLARGQLWLLSTACGLAVATIYYNQPLLAAIAQGLGLGPDRAGLFAMLTQIGYAAGLLLFVPLGDSGNRKRLLCTLLAFNGAALLAFALAPNAAWALVASCAIGMSAVSAQIIIPAVASRVGEAGRGHAIGTLLSGLSAGLLFARTLSAGVGGAFGWRAMFLLAAVLDALTVGIVLWAVSPNRPRAGLSYPRLLASLWTLFRREPRLRNACYSGFCFFAAFSTLWGSLSLLLARPPFLLSVQAIGLFGLVGFAGLLVSPALGRRVDERGAMPVLLAGMTLVLLAFVLIGVVPGRLPVLVAAMVLIDVGNRAGMVANQQRIYAIDPGARSRLNTLFMVFYFLGGAAGTAAGSVLSARYGWIGLAGTGCAFIALCAAIHIAGRRGGRAVAGAAGTA
jgi:predicted MFS family arabinose efflux permease